MKIIKIAMPFLQRENDVFVFRREMEELIDRWRDAGGMIRNKDCDGEICWDLIYPGGVITVRYTDKFKLRDAMKMHLEHGQAPSEKDVANVEE